MGERTHYEPGTFSWVDLQTHDQDAAKAFYRGLLGWDYEDVPIGDGQVYSMAKLDGHSVAAISPTMAPPGSPPFWSCYVTVADVDATMAKAQSLGASTVLEPMDVFDAGRMGVFRDPAGAVLSVWEPRENIGAGLVNEIGALTWNDLITPDVETVAGFYRALFGWTVEPTPGADGAYWTIKVGDRLNAGMMSSSDSHPAWNLYFAVDAIDEAVTRVNELGGGILMGPMEVPAGSFAIFRDPVGAVFSLVDGTRDP